MAKEDERPETSSGQDSYSKIEAPVRDTIPDGARPVRDPCISISGSGLGDLYMLKWIFLFRWQSVMPSLASS